MNNQANAATEDKFTFAEMGAIDQKQKKEKKPKNKKRKIITVFSIVLAVLIVGAGCVYFYLRTALENAPPARANPTDNVYFSPVVPKPNVPQLPGQKTESAQKEIEYIRDDKVLKYTFLMLALDDGNGNTDVIMAATLDVTNHTFEIVSIPRDTLANVGWNDVKKANTIYANLRAQDGWDDKKLNESMDGVVDRFKDILGFKVDYWFLVDMRAVVALVNAIDGVDYYIPVNMNYDDVQAGLSIHFSQGMKHLNGQQALELLRFRRYADADIGRIGTQQDFLMTAAKQILEKQKSIDIYELARIFLNNVKTDIVLSNLIWFGQEFLKLEPDDINFNILPGNYWDSVYGDSYVTIYVNEWLEIVNSKLNPYLVDFTPGDVSILTRGADGRLYATDGNRKGNPDWGSGVGQSYNPESTSPSNSSPQAVDPANDPPDSSGGEPVDSDENPGTEITGEPPDDAEFDPGDGPIDGAEEPADDNPEDTQTPSELESSEEETPAPPDDAGEPPAPAAVEEAPAESAPSESAPPENAVE